jgi:hypothetical protein
LLLLLFVVAAPRVSDTIQLLIAYQAVLDTGVNVATLLSSSPGKLLYDMSGNICMVDFFCCSAETKCWVASSSLNMPLLFRILIVLSSVDTSSPVISARPAEVILELLRIFNSYMVVFPTRASAMRRVPSSARQHDSRCSCFNVRLARNTG